MPYSVNLPLLELDATFGKLPPSAVSDISEIDGRLPTSTVSEISEITTLWVIPSEVVMSAESPIESPSKKLCTSSLSKRFTDGFAAVSFAGEVAQAPSSDVQNIIATKVAPLDFIISFLPENR